MFRVRSKLNPDLNFNDSEQNFCWNKNLAQEKIELNGFWLLNVSD